MTARRGILAAVAATMALVAPSAAGAAEWLAGDLHVHTCFSHDAWCPPDDDNTGPDEFYALSLGVPERFAQASLQGLDYLALTDHNDVRSSADPGFGTSGVIGIPGYEASLRGHAQMLGAERIYDAGGETAPEVTSAAGELRADGGLLQVNHPGYNPDAPFTGCGDTGALHWSYGYDVRPDTIEVLNPTAPAQTAFAYWECWLDRDERIGATGGSDSHWAWTAPVHGPGNPTTWVLAEERSRQGVLDALRAGRTSISRRTPLAGGAPLVLEGDIDGDGVYESQVGDQVPPGTPLRVRAGGPLTGTGFVRVRAKGGKNLLDDAPITPATPVELTAPEAPGWVRATLYVIPATRTLGSECDPRLAQSVSLCPHDHVLEALTSAIYVR